MVTPKKRCEVDRVFDLLRAGFTKAQVQEKLSLKPSALANHLRRLEESDNIKRVGKYRIDILSSSHLHPKVTKNKVHIGFDKRGHGHNITIHFLKKVDFWELPQVKQDLKMKILKRLEFGSLKFVRDGFTIWINKHHLTIYSNNSYYSGDALHSKFSVLRNVDTLVENLILKYNFPKKYGIEIFREHYGLIFNKFAEWLNKKGKKMYVQDKKGKSILWVDKSRKDDVGLDEFEGEDPLMINNASSFFDSHEKHNFKIDADHILDKEKKTDAKIKDHDQVISKSMEVLKGYAEQIALHLRVEQKQEMHLGDQTKHLIDQTKLFKEIRDELRLRGK